MDTILIIIQTIVAAILIVLILFQSKGTGLSKAWGMGGGTSFTRRGLEKLLFKSTFVLVALFLIVSILRLLI